jgi:hypothetical protein
MRVAWVHPTWRDLVIERLAADTELRRRFLGRCGPYGVALALSTRGGAAGDRQLPLIAGDEDWDAIGDRIYALAPELEPRQAVTVLAAVDHLLELLPDDALPAAEVMTLARLALERFGELWENSHAVITLPCIDAWLSVATRLQPPPRPTFLGVTWANLLPTQLPDPDDFTEVQRFTDWQSLCEVVRDFSFELLNELGYGARQRDLMQAWHARLYVGRMVEEQIGTSSVDDAFIEESRARRISDSVIRRVLVDL